VSRICACLALFALAAHGAQAADRADWASATARELMAAYPECSGVVVASPPTSPAERVEMGGSLEASCNEIARRNVLNWQRVGSAVVFAAPPTRLVPWTPLDRTAWGYCALEDLVQPFALVGPPWSSLTDQWLQSGGGATWRALVDRRRVQSDTAPPDVGESCGAWLTATSLLPTGGITQSWELKSRAWHAGATWLAEGVLAQATGLCGSVPRLDERVTLTASGVLPEVVKRLGASETRAALALGLGFDELPVAVSVSDLAADDLLCALALACGGEWRDVGGLLFLSPDHQGLRWHEQNWLWRRHEGLPEPAFGPGRNSALLIGVPPPTAAAVGGLGPATPALSVEARMPNRAAAAMLVSWAPSRGVQWAFGAPAETRTADARSLHCAADSIMGYCAARGSPLPGAARQLLANHTAGSGRLTGQELIDLAKSAGVELVGAKGRLQEIGSRHVPAIVHLSWGHYVAVTDCDRAFVTLLDPDGRRARFPGWALESGMSGVMFVAPEALAGEAGEGGGGWPQP